MAVTPRLKVDRRLMAGAGGTTVLGYHGCDRSVGGKLLAGEAFQPSAKRHDWLGQGIYFWENDPLRALEWAEESRTRRNIKDPFVVGAVIAMGKCLDLTTREDLRLLTKAYEGFQDTTQILGVEMPKNEPAPGEGQDSRNLLRYLDRAVIDYMYTELELEAADARADPSAPVVTPFDTVRGLFVEGKPAYPGSGFYSKTHGQVAVRNAAAIRGVFIPRPLPNLGSFSSSLSCP